MVKLTTMIARLLIKPTFAISTLMFVSILFCGSIKAAFTMTIGPSASGNRVEVRQLQGTYHLADGNLQVRNLAMESLGGRVTGQADVNHLDATTESRVQIALRDISIAALQRALGKREIKGAVLSGTL